MTGEKFYEHICIMLREYDIHTGNEGADSVIANPENWVASDSFPFYASAAEILIEARTKLDTKTTPRTKQNAIKRIIKSVPTSRENFRGLFPYEDRFVVVDGYRLIRLQNDISSLPHVENDFDVASVMRNAVPTEETLHLPTVGELRAFVTENKVKRGRRFLATYCLNDFVWCNPNYLIDMIQALPGCVAYKPKSPHYPIYFVTPDGDDGILLPVRSAALENENKTIKEGEKNNGSETNQDDQV